MLPACIIKLIKAFAGKKERRPRLMKSYIFDYMRIDDWHDTEDVRAYGDF